MKILVIGSNSELFRTFFANYQSSFVHDEFMLVSNSVDSIILAQDNTRYMSIHNPLLCESIINFAPTCVLFLASPFHPRLSKQNFPYIYTNFLVKVIDIFSTVFPRLKISRFLFFSSFHAISNSFVVDNSSHTPYSSEKATLECFFASAANYYGFPFVSLRISNIVNPFSSKSDFGVFQVFATLIKKGKDKDVLLMDDGLEKDYIHIYDVCDVIFCLLQKSDFYSVDQGVNVGSGFQISPSTILESLKLIRDGSFHSISCDISYVNLDSLSCFISPSNFISISSMLCDCYKNA